MVIITCKNCNLELEMPNKRFKLCKECSRQRRLQRCRTYKLNNPKRIASYNKMWKKTHREDVSEYNREYNIANRETIRIRQTKRLRERRKNDVRYKMSVVLRNRLRKFYTGERPQTMKLVGLSMEKFVEWIAFNFSPDMSWENHGTVWHIDHLVPCSWFDLTRLKERKICFHWTNMRPLKAEINLRRQGCDLREILCQEISARTFSGKATNFEPLITKLSEKSHNGDG